MERLEVSGAVRQL